MASAAARSEQPLVVLAGWLGSQPKSLRRYEALYQRAGFQVLTRIASPTQVVGAVLRPPLPLRVPRKWPFLLETTSRRRSIQDLAWEILARIHQIQAPFVLFHVFSNGGGFLWEQVCRILDLVQDRQRHATERVVDFEINPQEAASLSEIRRKVRGVVFDSCPGSELHRIGEAIQYCTWKDRFDVMCSFWVDFLLIKQQASYQRLCDRAESYMDYLKTNAWDIPQLYLYSGDDPLARADAIDDLIASRKQLIGDGKVLRRRWDSSPHCRHLLMHPHDYEAAVDSFISLCTNCKFKSKL